MNKVRDLYLKIKDEKLTGIEILTLAETLILESSRRLKSEKLYDVYFEINKIRRFREAIKYHNEVWNKNKEK